jgi:predicted ester cyclase
VTPQGALPATQRRIDFRAHNEMRLSDGSIRELRISFDPADLMHQLGAGG